ncbi:hypothetical protein [Dinoroseobacter sp. S124A]|uniref:hypothetical protein n=1 Tax=Dinoroseobacter sp. S124A TaxID=3415128 RepID=UPI003C79E9E9
MTADQPDPVPAFARGFVATEGVLGVTGHRLDRLTPPHQEQLAILSRSLFARVHPACRLMSCLAEGADTITAEAWPADRGLLGLLPAGEAHWRANIAPVMDPARFDALIARAQVETLGQTPPVDWTALAIALVARVDRVLAIWDGAPGKPGGTGSVVAAARAAAKPVLHLRFDADGFTWVP